MKFFSLDFRNLMSCKNCNGVMLVNLFFKIFFQFSKNRVECPFKIILCIQSFALSIFSLPLLILR